MERAAKCVDGLLVRDDEPFRTHYSRVLAAETFVTEIAMDPVVDPPF